MVRCIVTDVEMPEMDGYVLTQKIKEDERFKNIPVIMHSSSVGRCKSLFGEGGGSGSLCAKVPAAGAGGRDQHFPQLR